MSEITSKQEFPTDVNRQTSTLFPFFGELEPTNYVEVGTNQLTASYKNLDGTEAAKIAVVVFDQATQSYIPTQLGQAADGALMVKVASSDTQGMRVLIDASGLNGFGVITRLDDQPIVVKQISQSPNKYQELLSIPGQDDESPKNPDIIALAASLGMNPSRVVEITSRICFPLGQDAFPLEGHLMGQRGGEGELSLEIAKRLPQLDLHTTRGATRGFSFDETFIGEGTVHSTNDTFYRSATFTLRMATI